MKVVSYFPPEGSLQTGCWVQTTHPQSITHCLYALRKRIVSLLSSVGAAPVRYLGDSLLGLDGSLLDFANEESACFPFLTGLGRLWIGSNTTYNEVPTKPLDCLIAEQAAQDLLLLVLERWEDGFEFLLAGPHIVEGNVYACVLTSGLFTTHTIHDPVALLRLERLRPLSEVRPVIDGVKQVPDVDHLVVVAGGKRIVGEGKAAAFSGLPIQLEKPLQFLPGHINAVEIASVNARGFRLAVLVNLKVFAVVDFCRQLGFDDAFLRGNGALFEVSYRDIAFAG